MQGRLRAAGLKNRDGRLHDLRSKCENKDLLPCGAIDLDDPDPA